MRRGRLLRREALELALYTLKYVPGTSAVLTYLPPPAGQASPTSVLVSRKDVAKDLDLGLIPLDRRFPHVAAWVKRMEALPGYERTVPPHWREG